MGMGMGGLLVVVVEEGGWESWRVERMGFASDIARRREAVYVFCV